VLLVLVVCCDSNWRCHFFFMMKVGRDRKQRGLGRLL
jgi:hypothetical protein